MTNLTSRLLTVLLAMTLTVAVAPHAGASPSPRSGSFVVTGVPYGDVTYNSPTATTYTCLDGQEGVHKGTLAYEAPASGFFTAEIAGFTGDWDLFFLDAAGDMVGANWHSQWLQQEGVERLTINLRRGQTISVVACNWVSTQTEVTVTFELMDDDGYLADPAPRLKGLAPGRLAGLHEKVPVNFVFVGLERDDVEVGRFLDALPARYRPMTRAVQWAYGEREFTGIEYDYDYDTTFSDKAYEDRFFGKLRSLATTDKITQYQQLYNQQESNVLDIDENYSIDAPTVERWLAKNPPAGVDTTENTLFFINWHGRSDFRHHVYTKLGEPDSDTGVDAGMYDSQKLSAWGGTTPDDEETGLGALHRVWFWDLSAGPEWVARNYIVDFKDLDADGIEDYRIPPIWEYTKKGYRKLGALTGDLARVARYVGINFLFTTSPIYYPGLTPPLLPKRINLDVNVYDGSTDYDVAEEWHSPKVIRQEVAELLPNQDVSIDIQSLELTDPKFLECYAEWFQLSFGPSCYSDKPYSLWANPFAHHAMTLDDTRDGPKTADYEAGSFHYGMDDDLGWAGGYSDENYWDGTQSFDHVFMISGYGEQIGMTEITIHEYGHHFGVSHPHDGYDYEEGVDYGFWNDRFAFVYLGTESNSIMDYLSVNNDFSQFDRDNMNRWHTAAYLNASNEILRRIEASDDAARVASTIATADDVARVAKRRFADHQYLGAARAAITAYEIVLDAADAIGLEIKPDLSGVTVRASADDSAAGYHQHSPHSHGPHIDSLHDRPIYEELSKILTIPALPAGLRGAT